jgi:hypothetical protein
MIYRPQRGSLFDAMKEVKEFNDVDEMKKFIVNDWSNNIAEEDIVIDEKVVNDDRIGWQDTRYVCAKKIGQEEYAHPQCIGYCATVYPK